MLSPKKYSSLLDELCQNYNAIREKVVETKAVRNASKEFIAEFHKPVSVELSSLGSKLDAIEDTQKTMINANLPMIRGPELYNSDITPQAKKRKIADRKTLRGSVDFDAKLEKIMNDGEDFYQQFGLQRINYFYRQLVSIESEAERVAMLQSYTDKVLPVLLRLSQSLSGKKSSKVSWDKEEINLLLSDKDIPSRDRSILEERLKILRQQAFVAEYRNSLRVLETNVKNPAIVKVNYGEGCVLFTSLDDMVDRLELLKGNIKGGNNSYQLINEARAICDNLLMHKVIFKPQYKRLYSAFTPPS